MSSSANADGEVEQYDIEVEEVNDAASEGGESGKPPSPTNLSSKKGPSSADKNVTSPARTPPKEKIDTNTTTVAPTPPPEKKEKDVPELPEKDKKEKDVPDPPEKDKKEKEVPESPVLDKKSSERNSDVPGSLIPYTSIPQIPPPWEEWSDAFINEETWNNEIYNGESFVDSFDMTEILQTKSFHWMRPSEFTSGIPAVVRFNSSVVDLISPNAHLCEKFEIIRYILGEISELYEYSLQNKFVECEGEGTVYVPNYSEEDRMWTPWSHIYSCCKAGVRGEKPAYNPKGLYYVRLYFLGTWRRVLVDDRIPVLPSGLNGLPLTALNELWPLLLTKALLKIATITWRETDDVRRFSSISALTGWIFEWVENIDGVNEDELWADLQNTLPKYMDPKKIPSCYTLLTPSRKKRVFGPGEGSDTFWWLPPLPTHPLSEPDNVTFTKADYEPLVQSEDANTNGYERIGYDVKWHRKTLHEIISDPTMHHRHHHNQQHQHKKPKDAPLAEVDHQSFSDKTDMPRKTDTAPSVMGKKSKKGKIKGGALLDEGTPSEKKVGKKEKKEKKKETHDKKAKDKDMKSVKAKPSSPKDPKEKDDKHHDKDKDKHHEKPTKEESARGIAFKATKNWSKLKNVLMGDQVLDARRTKSVRESLLQNLLLHPFEDDDDEEEAVPGAPPGPSGGAGGPSALMSIPTLQEILYGVEKYAGLDYRNMVKNWENICGKDSPITLVVVLKHFPMPHGNIGKNTPPPHVPSYLQHPIQLVEVRDAPLYIPKDRPPTPLWKRFRWKAWAMKKGLIPYEEDHSKDRIRAVKARTPFTFKTDWLESPVDDDLTTYPIADDEEYGEDDDVDLMMTTFFYGADSTAQLDHDMGFDSLSPSSVPDEVRQSLAVNGTEEEKKHSHVSSEKGGIRQTQAQIQAKEELNSNNRKKSNAGTTISDGSSGKKSTLQEDKSSENREKSPTLVLHSSEIIQGESEEEFDEEFRAAYTQTMATVAPSTACGTLWLECDEIARNLKKFCKFYISQSIFGSCFILRREPNVIRPILDPGFQDVRSTIPKFPHTLTEYKRKDSYNCVIEFEKRKTYHVSNYHLDSREGVDSAFYLFSDCWTEQELIINIRMLQEEVLKGITTVPPLPKQEDIPVVPPPTPAMDGKGFGMDQPLVQDIAQPYTPVSLSFILEPWDWRRDSCLCDPLIWTSVTDQFISHVRLPAGRHIFRIWITLKNPDGSCMSADLDADNEYSETNKINCTPFVIRIVSQTPTFVGSRSEVLNYMVNPPMLFLKQAERLANSLWGLFACYGRKRNRYMQNLRELRRSYCPAYTNPNKINAFVRGAHDTFEELILSLVKQYNDGILDRMTLLTLRVLFLDPNLGRHYVPKSKRKAKPKESNVYRSHFIRHLGKKARALLPSATMTIQRYYRGWRVRRLFQMRNKSHPAYHKIEYKIRKIAYMMAQETDSVFTHPEMVPHTDDEVFPKVEVEKPIDPEQIPPTILPQPPHWAFELLGYLTDRHPWLLTIYPHAHCVAHHVKIQEFEGELPKKMKDFCWYPFCREVLKVVPESKSCFIEIDLQVYPKTGIYMKIVNNDTGKMLASVNDQLFIGRLAENKRGYTILCYRWALPNIRQNLNDRLPRNRWKIRVITPHTQDGPRFAGSNEYNHRDSILSMMSNTSDANKPSDNQDNPEAVEEAAEDTQETKPIPPAPPEPVVVPLTPPEIPVLPRKLCLRKFSGHYIPNKDYSLCQYALETDEKRVTISLRFKASNDKAKIRILIWDCTGKNVLYEETCEGGVITPVIQLHRTKPKRKSKEEPDDILDGNNNDVDDDDLAFLDNEKSKNFTERPDQKKPDQKNDQQDETLKLGDQKKYRYIISVHTDEESWPLLDHELMYLFYKERQFFKEIKHTYCKDYIKVQMEKAAQQMEREQREKELMEAEEEEEEEGAVVDNTLSLTEPSTTAIVEVILPPNSAIANVAPPSTAVTAGPEPPEKPKEEGVTKPKKRHTKKDKSGFTGDKDKDKDKDKAQARHNSPPNEAETPYPSTPPPTTVSHTSLTNLTKKKDQKLKRRSNGNLILKYGGKQSQHVRHLDQPHWVLEVLTDESVNYKVKNNWNLLKKRLLQMKPPWDEEGSLETLYRELSLRLDYFLENIIDINAKHDEKRYSVVDPVTNVFACLGLEDYELRGLANSDLVDLFELVWSKDPRDNLKAAEKLAHLKKKKRASRRKDLTSSSTTPGSPPRRIDYLPKNLKRLIERVRKQAEQKEAERQLKLLMPEHYDEVIGEVVDEEEEEEEEDDYITSAPTSIRDTIAVSSEKELLTTPGAKRSIFIDAKSKKGKSTRGKKSMPVIELPSAPSKKKRKTKEFQQTELKESGKGKEKDKEKDKEKEKTVTVTSATSEPPPPSVPEVEEEEEVEEPLESHLEKLRQCEIVRGIFEKYMELFKDPDPIRQKLVHPSGKHVDMQETPRKLVLTRSGIGKYCGISRSSSEEKEKEMLLRERPSTASAVADKLLQWTMDLTCLPTAEEQPEKIKDFGEFSQFFVQSVIQENPEYYVYNETAGTTGLWGAETDTKDGEEEEEEGLTVPSRSATGTEGTARYSRVGTAGGVTIMGGEGEAGGGLTKGSTAEITAKGKTPVGSEGKPSKKSARTAKSASKTSKKEKMNNLNNLYSSPQLVKNIDAKSTK